MKNTSKPTILAKVVNVVKPVKAVSVQTRRYVNNDGTIAENIDTYRQFKADLNNRNYGW